MVVSGTVPCTCTSQNSFSALGKFGDVFFTCLYFSYDYQVPGTYNTPRSATRKIWDFCFDTVVRKADSRQDSSILLERIAYVENSFFGGTNSWDLGAFVRISYIFIVATATVRRPSFDLRTAEQLFFLLCG